METTQILSELAEIASTDSVVRSAEQQRLDEARRTMRERQQILKSVQKIISVVGGSSEIESRDGGGYYHRVNDTESNTISLGLLPAQTAIHGFARVFYTQSVSRFIQDDHYTEESWNKFVAIRAEHFEKEPRIVTAGVRFYTGDSNERGLTLRKTVNTGTGHSYTNFSKEEELINATDSILKHHVDWALRTVPKETFTLSSTSPVLESLAVVRQAV